MSSPYAKLYVALAGGVVQALTMFYGANNAYVALVVGLLTAFGVYKVPNTPAV